MEPLVGSYIEAIQFPFVVEGPSVEDSDSLDLFAQCFADQRCSVWMIFWTSFRSFKMKTFQTIEHHLTVESCSLIRCVQNIISAPESFQMKFVEMEQVSHVPILIPCVPYVPLGFQEVF